MTNKSPKQLNEEFYKSRKLLNQFRMIGLCSILFSVIAIVAKKYCNDFLNIFLTNYSYYVHTILILLALLTILMSFFKNFIYKYQINSTLLIVIDLFGIIFSLISFLYYMIFIIYPETSIKSITNLFILLLVVSCIYQYFFFKRRLKLGNLDKSKDISKENKLSNSMFFTAGGIGLLASRSISNRGALTIIVVIGCLLIFICPQIIFQTLYILKLRIQDKKYWEIPEEKNNNLD